MALGRFGHGAIKEAVLNDGVDGVDKQCIAEYQVDHIRKFDDNDDRATWRQHLRDQLLVHITTVRDVPKSAKEQEGGQKGADR